MKSSSFFAGGEQRLSVITAGLASAPASCDHERMYVVELDRSKRLLVISAAQGVTAEQAKLAAQRVRELLQSVAPGFRVLADFRWLDSMESAAARHIAGMMDALAEKGVASVTRVMPDPHKDIGLNILSQFHYGPEIKIGTFETLADALQSLTRE